MGDDYMKIFEEVTSYEAYIKSLKPTAQVKVFALELLGDCQEHSRQEIISYVYKKASDLDLPMFSRGNVNGGLQDLLQLDNCKKIKTGVYQLVEDEQKKPITQVDKAIIVCEDAVKKIQNISRTIDYITATDKELEFLEKLKIASIELNKIIDNLKN